MNLDDLVRAALAEEAGAEPDEAGAYQRFLRHRRRRALTAAASTGLAVALVLAVAVGGALLVRGGGGDEGPGPVAPAPTTAATPTSEPPTGPVETTLPAPPPVTVSAGGVVRRGRQGFELTLPDGWKVDQSTTASYAQFGQPWLVISPGGRPTSATRDERITIFTTVASPSEYPGKPGKGGGNMGGQSFSSLAGARSSGRRADGRAFTAGDQGAMVSYHIAWPYRCAGLCPEAGPWRVLRLDVEGTGRQEGLNIRRVARRLVESIRPTTNAVAPAEATVAEEPGLFADAPVVVGRGGKGDYAWEVVARKGSGRDYWVETRRQNGALFMGESFDESERQRPTTYVYCAPSRERATATLLMGVVPEEVARVVVDVEGQPSVETRTFRKKGFPMAFWVIAPLPPEARPRSFTGYDAAGQQVANDTKARFAGFADGCR